jgi:hypothetical protein
MRNFTISGYGIQANVHMYGGGYDAGTGIAGSGTDP